MFALDLRSRVPIYEQLVEKTKELIINNVLKPDEQLPTVRDLAGELTINPNTIQKAYRELEHQGYIYSVPGRGNFVMPAPTENNSTRLQALAKQLTRTVAEMRYLGMTVAEIATLIEKTFSHDKGGQADDRG
jgi:GntR family transcriptional regulator